MLGLGGVAFLRFSEEGVGNGHNELDTKRRWGIGNVLVQEISRIKSF